VLLAVLPRVPPGAARLVASPRARRVAAPRQGSLRHSSRRVAV